jgi:parallel beta-helix repeat protein
LGEVVVKKSASALVLLLFLSVVMVFLPQIGIVKAESTIVIDVDGNVVPATATIQRVGNVYTLTGDIDRIMVERNDTILDGDGHTISGRFDAVFLRDVKNVAIKNLIITSGEVGIGLYRCSNITVSNNTITGTSAPIPEVQTTAGIVVSAGSYNIITGNIITNNYGGIAIGNDAIHNIVFGNNITHNNYGIGIGEVFDNTIQHNNFVNNSLHVDVGDNSNYIFWDNGEEGNYWDNYSGLDSDEDGIGDTPYVINEGNRDNYPLMAPVSLTIIPEFQSWILLPLFLMATFVGIGFKKRLSQSVKLYSK